MSEAFCGQGLREATFLAERRQLVLYLPAEHQAKTIAEHHDTVGHRHRVLGKQPLVEAMLLLQDVAAALVKDIVLLVRLVGFDACHLAVLRRMR